MLYPPAFARIVPERLAPVGPSRRRIRAGTAAVLVGLTSGCGPTSEDIGQAVLQAAPIVTLLALLVAWVYAMLWEPLVPDLRLDPRPSVIVIAAQLAIAVASLFLPQLLDLANVLFFGCVVGASHLTLAILALRISVHRGSRRYSWALLAPIPILVPPALVLAVFGDSLGILKAAWTLWALPAWGLGPIVLLALVEVLVRRARARQLTR